MLFLLATAALAVTFTLPGEGDPWTATFQFKDAGSEWRDLPEREVLDEGDAVQVVVVAGRTGGFLGVVSRPSSGSAPWHDVKSVNPHQSLVVDLGVLDGTYGRGADGWELTRWGVGPQPTPEELGITTRSGDAPVREPIFRKKVDFARSGASVGGPTAPAK